MKDEGMKSDGDAMETTEPTEAVPEPSSTQEATLEQARSQPEPAADSASGTHLKANGKPLVLDPKMKPKVDLKKPAAKPTGACASNPRPGAASQRAANDVKALNNVVGNKTAAAAKSSSAAAKSSSAAAEPSSAAGAVPKKHTGVATSSAAVKSQRKVPEKKPVGQSKTASLPASPVTKGTKLAAVNGSAKTRPGSETVRAKTTAPSRPAASSAPKPSSSTPSKAGVPPPAKTSKPIAGPPRSRPATATSRPATATSKPPIAAATKTTTVRATPAPSAGKTAAAQPLKTAPPKKDVGRPLSAAAAKKPPGGAAATAARKPETSKATVPAKLNSAPKLSTMPKASDPKVPQPQNQPLNSSLKKKPAAPVRLPTNNKPPLGRTPPASPASKPENRTVQSKGGVKPIQAVLPLTVTKKTGAKNTSRPAEQTRSVPAPAAEVPADTTREAPESIPQESSLTASVPEPVVPAASALPEMATEAPESLSHQSSLTVPVPDSVSSEANVPAEAVGDAPEPPPQPPSLPASIQDTVSPEVHVPVETAAEAPEPTPHQPFLTASVPEEAPVPTLVPTTQLIPEETWQSRGSDPSAPPSSVETGSSQPSELLGPLESDVSSIATQERPLASGPPSPPAESQPAFSEEPVLAEPPLPPPSTAEAQETTANSLLPKVPPSSLNEDEDEEEREASQLISVSEMSGTTQATEDSRPGSGGPVGGSAWRAGGGLLSELDSEEVSGSQQGASELSAPGVLEGTESMDDLGDGSLKGAMDMEGASAGSPDFEKVSDIPANDFEEDEEDEDDRVCDMDVGSERADEPQRPRHDNDVEDEDEEDDDVEMASEGITESGLESYGNADEDDFVEDERLDNLNRVGQHPPPPPLLPSAPAAQWDQPNPLAHPWSDASQRAHEADAAAGSPLADPWQADSQTPTQTPAQAWLDLGLGLGSFAGENQDHFAAGDQAQSPQARLLMGDSDAAPEALSAPRVSLSGTLSSKSSTPEEQPRDFQALARSSSPELNYPDLVAQMEKKDGEEDEEAETLPADEVLGGPATAPASNPSSSSSASEDEPSDTEGEAHLDASSGGPIISHVATEPASQRCLSTVEEGEGEEADMECAAEDTTPPSATSLASYGFDSVTTASNSNAFSTGESCTKSPGIFSLEELPDEPKKPGDPPQPHLQPCLSEQPYIDCGKPEGESADQEEERRPVEALGPSGLFQLAGENPDDLQPPYYSAICEKTENSFAGFTALPHPHRPGHAARPRNYCDIVRPCGAMESSPASTFSDPPAGGLGQQAPSPQLCRLEQHQKQLLKLQQSCPLEEAALQRKRKEKEEAGPEIKENNEESLQTREEEELKRRRDLELQLQQQQEELKQRQQIMQWQQELQQANQVPAVLLSPSPSSGLCTIYEALENSDEEEGDGNKREPRQKTANVPKEDRTDGDGGEEQSPSSPTPLLPDSPETPGDPSQGRDGSPSESPATPEQPSPPDLDWGKKVDIVQQLINQTLLLNRDGCSSLLLLPGGAGGTLSPLESSLWPSLLPPLTPPSATVTSVSSFSPETTGSSPQEEWTVVELETHH